MIRRIVILAVLLLAAAACTSAHRGGGGDPDADVSDSGTDGAIIGERTLLWPGSLIDDAEIWHYPLVHSMEINGGRIGLAASGLCCSEPINNSGLDQGTYEYWNYVNCQCTGFLSFWADSPEQLNHGSYGYMDVLGSIDAIGGTAYFIFGGRVEVASDGSDFLMVDNVRTEEPIWPDFLLEPLTRKPPLITRWNSQAEVVSGPTGYGDVYSFPYHTSIDYSWRPLGPNNCGKVSLGMLWGPENAYPDYLQDVYFQVDEFGIDGGVENVITEVFGAEEVFVESDNEYFGICGVGGMGTFLWENKLTTVHALQYGIYIAQATIDGEVTIAPRMVYEMPDDLFVTPATELEQIDDLLTLIVVSGTINDGEECYGGTFSIAFDINGNDVAGPTPILEGWYGKRGGDNRDLAWSGKFLGYCFEGGRFMALSWDGHLLGGPWEYAAGGETIEDEHLHSTCALAAIDEDTFAVAWPDRFGDESGIYYTTIDVTLPPE